MGPQLTGSLVAAPQVARRRNRARHEESSSSLACRTYEAR